MRPNGSSAKSKTKPPLVLDANIIFDLQHSSILLHIFRLNHTFITTDLIERDELKSVNPSILRGAGMEVRSLSGQQMAEAGKLLATYRGPSIHDISAFIYARDNGMELATRDSSLWQVATDQNVAVIETHDLIREMIEADVLTHKEAADALNKVLARLPVRRLDWVDLIKEWRKR